MAVGFAIKFFGGPNGENPLLGDLAVIGEAEDEEDYVVEPFSANRLPDAWHWAASHTPRTANQNYGLTVDFRQGLTDAALQEYFNVCRQWHLLVYPRLARGAAAAPPDREIGSGARKHTRAQSSVTNISLVKRMALREAPHRPLRQWDLQDAEKLLHRFYGSAAIWKTANQKLAMKRILQGYSRVVAILATGEGKSLLYQLPTQLAYAATTVVLVPLVALKFGM